MDMESFFAKITGVLAIAILFIGVYYFYTQKEEEKPNTNEEVINKLPPSTELEIFGTYIVKEDKTSKLVFKENGEYELTVNLCNGYLDISGTYEKASNKIRLKNNNDYEDYPSLVGNTEFSLTIIDENTIRLDEDLVCLFQNTLFEK